MKKILLFCTTLMFFASCSMSNVNSVKEDTKLPMEIVTTLRNDSLVLDSKLVITDDNAYIIQKDSQGKPYVAKYMESRVEYGIFIFLGVVVAIVVIGLIGLFLS